MGNRNKVLPIIVSIVLLAVVGIDARARFNSYKVYKIFVENELQLKQLKELNRKLPIQYLTDTEIVGRSYKLIVDPSNEVKLEQLLQASQFSFNQTNLENVLNKYSNKSEKSAMDWTQYHNLEEIYAWLDSLAVINPFMVTSYTIGQTYEGRPIKAIKVSMKEGNKAIFIESNIHANEWIGSATGTCFFEKLIYSDRDLVLRDLLTSYDWIFVPIVNPDGFVYSHDVGFWRKNRNPTGFSNSSGPCYGTDLNRNFNYNWGVAGKFLDDPCAHYYAGPHATSELEVIAMQNFINSFPDDYIRIYLALHSYGNLVLLPYGHTIDKFPPNYEQMMRIGRSFADAAEKEYGTKFSTGASGQLMNMVSGAGKDWAYGVKNVPFSATVELRDTGEHGVWLPPEQISEVCTEFTAGMKALFVTAKEEGIFETKSASVSVHQSIASILLVAVSLKIVTTLFFN